MSNLTERPIALTLAAEPDLARLVRMTAANVGALAGMSVDRIEDMRMVAEEAFIYAASADPDGALTIMFSLDDDGVRMTFELALEAFPAVKEGDPAAYADLLLAAVCDSYERTDGPARLVLALGTDA